MSGARGCGVQGEATGRAIKLARLTKTPLYVVHVMSKDAAEEIVKGRATGQKVWGEVVAGAIGLTDQKWSDFSYKQFKHQQKEQGEGYYSHPHYQWALVRLIKLPEEVGFCLDLQLRKTVSNKISNNKLIPFRQPLSVWGSIVTKHVLVMTALQEMLPVAPVGFSMS